MIIVTGAYGFIGWNLCNLLADHGVPFIAVDAAHPNRRNPPPPAWWHLVENQTAEEIASFAHGMPITAVVHLGGIANTQFRDWAPLMEMNVADTLRWWRWCIEEKVPMVMASSAATYGAGPFKAVCDFQELRKLKPCNPYAMSKHVTDCAMVQMAQSGFAPPRWYIAKLFNVYGPGEQHKGNMKSWPAKVFDALDDGEHIALLKHPTVPDPQRDFIDVRSVCETLAGMATSDNWVPGIYNVGTSRAWGFRKVAEYMTRIYAKHAHTNVPIRITEEPMPGSMVDGYQVFTEAEGVVIDPMDTETGLEWYVTKRLAGAPA